MKDRTRACIIGFAHMHVNEIASYITSAPGFVLAGFADLPPAVPEKTRARYTRAWNLENVRRLTGIAPDADYRAMLDRLKPDLAFILTENDRKAEVVKECAERGVGVVIEKPMALNLEEAESIRTVTAKNGVEAMVNWPVIWRPYVHRELAALESGVMGRLQKVYYINGHTGPLGKGARHRGVEAAAEEMTDEERASTWWYREGTGGGAFLDIGCYGFFYNTWARPAEDRPLEVRAFAGNYGTPFMPGAVPDNMAAVIAYRDSYGVIEGTWTMPQRFLPTGPVFCCADGVIYTTPEKDVKAMSLTGEEVELPLLPEPAHIANLPDHYAYAGRNGLPLLRPVTLEFNLRVAALLDAAERSAASGAAAEVPWEA
ncbi:MAG: Gfo/Idh/MocA family oxidoreductase [Clostridia bacterium]|nr:Gfo/Idh/MocA family oxidoreductase [Clostridia bacterium]